MKTYAHLWQYLSQFFWEWEMFQTKFAAYNKTHILFSIAFSQNRGKVWYSQIVHAVHAE